MEESKKEKLFMKVEVHVRVGFSWGSGEHPWVPLPHERAHSYENLYYNVNGVANKPCLLQKSHYGKLCCS
jgi:hypothetical protein